MIKKIISYLWNILTNINKKPHITYYEFLALFYFSFGRKKDISIMLGNKLYVFPLDPNALSGIREIWTLGAYDKLIGCKKVLDLGGFLGESGLWLAENNSSVSIYEANKLNYTYIIKNVLGNDKIKSYYGAVVGDVSIKEINFNSTGFDLGGRVDTKSINTVPAFFIGDIDSGCDGLKMDIEGEEYRVMDYYISHNIRNYAKGYIEFHDMLIKKNQDNLNNIVSFLIGKGYVLERYKADSKKKELLEIVSLDGIGILYFEKN